MELLFYFILTLFFTTLFSMGGVGSAIALVSIFPMTGMPLNMAKVVGLFINTTSTISMSVMNLIRGVLDFRFALPLIITTLISTPFGAYLSQYASEYWIKWLFITFLLVSAILLVKRKHEAKYHDTPRWVMFLIGGVVGTLSGLLGVGGGALIIPLLILLGFEPKKAAYTVSFVIPFSSFSGFVTYLSFVKVNWTILAVVSVAAFFGGIIGNRIMHFRLTADQVKQLIALVLFLLAGKLIYAQF